MKKILLLILVLIPINVLASDITSSSEILLNESVISEKVKDNKESTYITISKDDTIKIKNNKFIEGLYIVYERTSVVGTITIDNVSKEIGVNNFLHEYINLENNKTNELTIKYNNDVKIADIYVLSNGKLPEYVEVWNPPYNEADLVLFSTHSDDEQLFFLGLLPTYVARGANVQVVYFTNHFDNTKRLHEQLHGLYAVGVRAYPIIGPVPDAWATTLDGAISNMEKSGISEEDALKYQVEMIRRFKPQVIVGHDENGEYKHGQHMLNTYLLKEAIIKANDESYDTESVTKYGLWDTPKLYLHLYKENTIVMDYDTPLEYFDGKTAYEVSKVGYSKHLSQQWTWFTDWINGKNNEYTKSTDIKTYSPNEFGLYRSLVGEDINKNDMFENLTLRKDQVKEEIKEEEEKEEETPKKKDFKKFILPISIMASAIILLILFIILK